MKVHSVFLALHLPFEMHHANAILNLLLGSKMHTICPWRCILYKLSAQDLSQNGSMTQARKNKAYGEGLCVNLATHCITSLGFEIFADHKFIVLN